MKKMKSNVTKVRFVDEHHQPERPTKRKHNDQHQRQLHVHQQLQKQILIWEEEPTVQHNTTNHHLMGAIGLMQDALRRLINAEKGRLSAESFSSEGTKTMSCEEERLLDVLKDNSFFGAHEATATLDILESVAKDVESLVSIGATEESATEDTEAIDSDYEAKAMLSELQRRNLLSTITLNLHSFLEAAGLQRFLSLFVN